jgi:hypothetical protein
MSGDVGIQFETTRVGRRLAQVSRLEGFFVVYSGLAAVLLRLLGAHMLAAVEQLIEGRLAGICQE